MQVLLDETYLKIEFDDDRKWLITTWKNYQTMETIMAGGAAMIEAVKSKSCGIILNDNRQVRGSWIFAGNWIINQWTPDIISAGLNRMAWIMSPDSLSQFSVSRSTSRQFENIIRVFGDYNKAVEWLEESDQAPTST